MATSRAWSQLTVWVGEVCGGGLLLMASVSSSGSEPATGGHTPGSPLPAGCQPDAFRLRPAALAVRDDHQVSFPVSHPHGPAPATASPGVPGGASCATK